MVKSNSQLSLKAKRGVWLQKNCWDETCLCISTGSEMWSNINLPDFEVAQYLVKQTCVRVGVGLQFDVFSKDVFQDHSPLVPLASLPAFWRLWLTWQPLVTSSYYTFSQIRELKYLKEKNLPKKYSHTRWPEVYVVELLAFFGCWHVCPTVAFAASPVTIMGMDQFLNTIFRQFFMPLEVSLGSEMSSCVGQMWSTGDPCLSAMEARSRQDKLTTQMATSRHLDHTRCIYTVSVV